jgi:5,10-methylenetetrahydromethanopterin reductase
VRRAEIGLGLQGDQPPGGYARLARQAEADGFDVLSVYGDLMYQPPIGPLLEMAAATDRVRLGPACLNPYSLAPYEIAGQVAALDLASGGRGYLGLARGTWLAEVGIAPARPLATLAEAAEVVYRLLGGRADGFRGRVFRLAPGTALRYPVQRPDPPLLIGAWGPRGVALAGRIADELKVGGSANPALVPVVRDRLRAGTGPAGRRIDQVGIVFGAVTVVDPDGAAARDRARAEVVSYLAVVGHLDPTTALPAGLLARVRELVAAGDHPAAGRLIPDRVLDRFAFAGTPEQVARQAQALIDAGVHRVEFGTPHGLTGQRGVELLGSAVLPLLRRLRPAGPAGPAGPAQQPATADRASDG